MGFSDRLKILRNDLNVTQEELAKNLNLKRSTIAGYESENKEPDFATLQKIADFFEVTVDYLLGRTDIKNPIGNKKELNIPASLAKDIKPIGNRKQLPIIGVVKAGSGGLAYEDHQGFEYVEEEDINGGEYFWLTIKGDSMSGDGIYPGDLALIRVQPEVEEGSIAIVIVENEEGTIKRVFKKENSIVLQSSNPTYPPRIFTGQELRNVRIVGKVKQIKRKF